MKATYFFAAAAVLAVLASGCASTDSKNATYDAKWVVVSTNEPASSDTLDRRAPNAFGGAPAHPPSILLAPDGQSAREDIETNGIPPVLKKKMLDGEVLTLADIEDLAHYKVSEGTILKYLQATGAIYVLRTEDVNRLQQAGVSKGVIDYMLSTVNQRPVQVVKRYYRYYNYDPSWYYPSYPYYQYYYPYYSYPYHSHGYYHGGGDGGGLRVYRPR
ncbi:MAG TPA: hypothetical protein VK615_00470 [Candidatus Binatia bacterium]|nr:hypothetical protein [Candidatus Binatia bacterium]